MIQEISKKDKWIPILVFFLLLVAVFLNLGIYPLYLEEPRRALISLEMLYNDNLWVPTEFGVYYYKKPPFYNWVIIAGYKLFNDNSEFAVRFFSVVSYLLMGVATFWAGRKYVHLTFGIYAAFLFFICSDLLFYFTITSGEIDLFYSLIVYLSFLTIFHFYRQSNFWMLFQVSYFLTAIGVLTKGLPSIVFQGISIITVFLYHKNFKGLFKLSHFAGIFTFIIIVGGYALIYSQYNDPSLFIFSRDSIVSQSMERTPFENGFFKVILHLFEFPLELLKILAPGSLFILLFFTKKARKSILQNDYIRFCLVLIVANIWVYWISPGTASRYLYMFFPLMITVVAYPLFVEETSNKIKSILKYIFMGVMILFFITSIALPFISRLQNIPNLVVISVLGALCFAGVLYWFIKWPKWQLMSFITAFILMRVLFDLIILPIRATEELGAQEKAIAEEIHEITADAPIYIYKEEVAFRSAIFYLERDTQKVLKLDSASSPNQFYLANFKLIAKDQPYETYYQFNHKGIDFGLIKFNP
ncbi:MAG: glycosyltransferase family 39 protein [Cyclobacteriaceae bacterium]|nr:glycosyltransferase family 39 protein [Cyclobacteriaceae bacterium SS2]